MLVEYCSNVLRRWPSIGSMSGVCWVVLDQYKLGVHPTKNLLMSIRKVRLYLNFLRYVVHICSRVCVCVFCASMLAHRIRCRPNNKLTLGQLLVFVGLLRCAILILQQAVFIYGSNRELKFGPVFSECGVHASNIFIQ